MNKKTLVIVGVLVAAAGIGFLLYKKRKAKNANADVVTQETEPVSNSPLPSRQAQSEFEQLRIAVAELVEKIKANKEWYDSVVTKAKEAGRTVEQQLEMDAKFMLSQNQK